MSTTLPNCLNKLLQPSVPAIEQLKAQAQTALENGEFDRAEQLSN